MKWIQKLKKLNMQTLYETGVDTGFFLSFFFFNAAVGDVSEAHYGNMLQGQETRMLVKSGCRWCKWGPLRQYTSRARNENVGKEQQSPNGWRKKSIFWIEELPSGRMKTYSIVKSDSFRVFLNLWRANVSETTSTCQQGMIHASSLNSTPCETQTNKDR